MSLVGLANSSSGGAGGDTTPEVASVTALASNPSAVNNTDPAHPVISTTLGTSSTTAAAGNDSRITGAAQKASNLSDLASAPSARTNLGLAAVAASGSASDLGAGTLPTGRFPGGAFNGASELVQLDGSSKMPAVDGSQLTNLPSGLPSLHAGSLVIGSPSLGSYSVTTDGSSVGVATGNYASPMPSGVADRTWRVWYAGTGVNDIEGLIFVGKSDGTNGFAIYIQKSLTRIVLRALANTGGGAITSAMPNVWDGNPHMIEVVFNGGAETVQARVDGVNIGTPFTVTGTGIEGGSPTTGVVNFGRDDPTSPLPLGAGDRLDEGTIFPVALTAAQSLADYAVSAGNYHAAVLARSPVGYWKLDELTGATIAADAANNFPLTYNAGHVTFQQTPLADTGGIAAGTPIELVNGSTGQLLAPSGWAGATAWTDVVGGVGFQNSWADAGGAFAHTGFRKDGSGRVDFRVAMKSGASASVAFTFPAGYRPAASMTFTGQAELVASDVPVELLVASDGTATVTFVGSLTGNVYVTGCFWNAQ